MKRSSLLPLVVLLALSMGVPGCDDDPMEDEDPEQGCLASGGQVRDSACCLATGDFPNSCLVGACGCSPGDSHSVRTCVCPSGQCFDGTRCVGGPR